MSRTALLDFGIGHKLHDLFLFEGFELFRNRRTFDSGPSTKGKPMNRSLLLEFHANGLLPLNEVLSLLAAGKLRGRYARLALRGAQLEAEAEKLLDGSEERREMLDEAAEIEDIFLTAAA